MGSHLPKNTLAWCHRVWVSLFKNDGTVTISTSVQGCLFGGPSTVYKGEKMKILVVLERDIS